MTEIIGKQNQKRSLNTCYEQCHEGIAFEKEIRYVSNRKNPVVSKDTVLQCGNKI